MTNEEHKSAAMLLGGSPFYTTGLYCARILKSDGRFRGTGLYDYVNVKTGEIIHTNRSEVLRDIERYSTDDYENNHLLPSRV